MFITEFSYVDVNYIHSRLQQLWSGTTLFWGYQRDDVSKSTSWNG